MYKYLLINPKFVQIKIFFMTLCNCRRLWSIQNYYCYYYHYYYLFIWWRRS